MTARYDIRPEWAWLEALDGGRAERVAWVANVETGAILTLEETAWLVWILLAEGPADASELRSRAASEGAPGSLDAFDLEEFLGQLVDAGVLAQQ